MRIFHTTAFYDVKKSFVSTDLHLLESKFPKRVIRETNFIVDFPIKEGEITEVPSYIMLINEKRNNPLDLIS